MVWADVELAHLTRGWLYASENGVAGVDQTGARFIQTMFDKFKLFALAIGAGKSYGARSQKFVKAKLDEIAPNIQEFRESLRFVRAAQPTIVTEDETLSISIACKTFWGEWWYVVRCTIIPSCRMEIFTCVLRHYPKFSDEGSVPGGEAEASNYHNYYQTFRTLCPRPFRRHFCLI